MIFVRGLFDKRKPENDKVYVRRFQEVCVLGIYFEKCLVPGRYGVHVDIPEAEGLFIAMPERVQQCDDVEEAVVLFLEFIEKRIKFFVAASSLEISDLVIEQAIYENMGLITAVYYYSRGSVLNVTRKEDA